MTKKQPDPANSDFKLWRDQTQDVQPLRQRPRLSPSAAPKPARAQMRRSDEEAVLIEAMTAEVPPEDWNTGDENQFRRSGVAATTLRKLRRGQFHIQGTLDLHGLSRQKAHDATLQFLHLASTRNWRCIKIIHGKGLRSPQGQPVLKARVQLTLQRTDDVLAYGSAPAWEGGHGAVLVLLRKA